MDATSIVVVAWLDIAVLIAIYMSVTGKRQIFGRSDGLIGPFNYALSGVLTFLSKRSLHITASSKSFTSVINPVN